MCGLAGRRLWVVEGAAGQVGASAVGQRGDGPARCAPDPGVFQQECIDAFVGSQAAQGSSQITIDNGTGVLERFLALADKPAWEITEDDVDRVIAALVKRGVTQTTRRGYVQAFRGFFAFLEARKAVEIEALFGCRLRDPLDRFNSARHVTSETPGLVPPPTVERVDAFFDFLRERLETARKWAPAARDYALFRTLYHAGLRAQEAAALELRDVHFNRGPFGKLHVRLGRARADRAQGRGGCRCSISWTSCCAGIRPRRAPGSGRRVRCCSAISRLAARAAADDVPVTLEVTPGVPHLFQAFAAILDEGEAALQRVEAFLRTHLAVQIPA